jgi:alkyl sulfatase BDS1-like metallo-beta-lactamase superfamily hydrolase
MRRSRRTRRCWGQLPFNDTSDFDDANGGFIAGHGLA